MRLSVLIPARNEAQGIVPVVSGLHRSLAGEGIDHEILVVDDHSTDGTAAALWDLASSVPVLRRIDNPLPPGYGFAVRAGLESFDGDAVAVFMADGSDSPEDLVRFYREMVATGNDCVFGSRFALQSKVVDYPRFKLLLNRCANTAIRILFWLDYNDVTNAFKLYRRRVILGIGPLLGNHYNLTVEMPLKAIVRGYSWSVLPNDWYNRRTGESKFLVREMGSRYLFIVIYCLIEKWLSRGDYRLPDAEGSGP